MHGRSLSFGSAAAAYERHRPGYPDEVVDEVLAYAGRPVAGALEIGAGTGKATRAFLRRGVAVTATEPDAEMLAELRTHVPASTTTVRAAFEDLPLDSAYDLVLAAASLHWTVAEGRWARMAAMLRAGGVVASFGGPFELAEPAVEQAVRRVRAPFLADDDVPSPDGTPDDAALTWPGTELVASPSFTDVRQLVVPRRLTMSASDYVGHLSTVSAYLVLPDAARATVLRQVLDVLPATVAVSADVTVHLARRVDDGASGTTP